MSLTNTGDGDYVTLVLYETPIAFPGPDFRGDPQNFRFDDDGLIVIEPGTPFRCPIEGARQLLAQYDGEIVNQAMPQ